MPRLKRNHTLSVEARDMLEEWDDRANDEMTCQEEGCGEVVLRAKMARRILMDHIGGLNLYSLPCPTPN